MAVFFPLPWAIKEVGVGFQPEDQPQEIGGEQHHRHCLIDIRLGLDGAGGDKFVGGAGSLLLLVARAGEEKPGRVSPLPISLLPPGAQVVRNQALFSRRAGRTYLNQ